ncbi:MAG: PKD domain-containing protein [Candidatus Thermoplasmatota archaeon]|nr:PKD domain-containing protein [Candidatus Thermoplasmatota archaeon]
MRKLLPIVVVGIFILTGFGVAGTPILKPITQNFKTELEKNHLIFGDELDQYQLILEFFAPVGNFMWTPDENYIIAQAFTPTKHILTRVELMAGRNSTATYDYTVTIRDALSGPDLTTISVEANQFPIENFSWIEFNFDDIFITPGSTYYIISSTVNATDNWYAWGAVLSDTYLNGTIFASTDDGVTWEEETDGDMTFKTYGRNNEPPAIPTITGTTNGKAGVEYDYTFTTTDPDDDEVYYWITWGDGCPAVEWIGPYTSGVEVTVSHTFDTKGDYIISAKTKDSYEAESDWGTLAVSMPTPKSTTDSIFGWTIIRGFVGNMKKQGNDLYFRAIRLNYTEITGMEISTGILRFKRCRISDMGPDRQLTFGPLGSFTWIFGICHGGLTEL